jgi:hypothetical protein
MITNLLNQSVTVAPWVSNDAKGRPVYGTAVTYRARVQSNPKIILSPSGQNVLFGGVTYVEPAAIIKVDSQITLPGPDYAQPIIVDVRPAYDRDGAMAYWRVQT